MRKLLYEKKEVVTTSVNDEINVCQREPEFSQGQLLTSSLFTLSLQ